MNIGGQQLFSAWVQLGQNRCRLYLQFFLWRFGTGISQSALSLSCFFPVMGWNDHALCDVIASQSKPAPGQPYSFSLMVKINAGLRRWKSVDLILFSFLNRNQFRVQTGLHRSTYSMSTRFEGGYCQNCTSFLYDFQTNMKNSFYEADRVGTHCVLQKTVFSKPSLKA